MSYFEKCHSFSSTYLHSKNRIIIQKVISITFWVMDLSLSLTNLGFYFNTWLTKLNYKRHNVRSVLNQPSINQRPSLRIIHMLKQLVSDTSISYMQSMLLTYIFTLHKINFFLRRFVDIFKPNLLVVNWLLLMCRRK